MEEVRSNNGRVLAIRSCKECPFLQETVNELDQTICVCTAKEQELVYAGAGGREGIVVGEFPTFCPLAVITISVPMEKKYLITSEEYDRVRRERDHAEEELFKLRKTQKEH